MVTIVCAHFPPHIASYHVLGKKEEKQWDSSGPLNKSHQYGNQQLGKVLLKLSLSLKPPGVSKSES